MKENDIIPHLKLHMRLKAFCNEKHFFF